MRGLVAIIQARMGSSRLPGKVMLDLCGHSVLWHVVERVRRCPAVERVVVATTRLPRDDLIASEAQIAGADLWRGSEDDVLTRYYEAACAFSARHVLRITSDCPLLDPQVVSAMLRAYQAQPALDYMSNVIVRRFPQGLDAEVMRMEALEAAFREAREAYQREHVTPYIYEHPERFKLGSYAGEVDLSHLRWTLDTPEDRQLIEAIYRALFPRNRQFTTTDVLSLLQDWPELVSINSHIKQKSLHTGRDRELTV